MPTATTRPMSEVTVIKGMAGTPCAAAPLEPEAKLVAPGEDEVGPEPERVVVGVGAAVVVAYNALDWYVWQAETDGAGCWQRRERLAKCICGEGQLTYGRWGGAFTLVERASRSVSLRIETHGAMFTLAKGLGINTICIAYIPLSPWQLVKPSS
jgi:hypothetical protein